jgi:hypothetical protein
MNGIDVSWAVIEGDFGLSRPGLVTPTVIYWMRPVAFPYGPPGARAPQPTYFPTTGQKPCYGRLEVEPAPDRVLPPPAPSYRKSWSSQSAPSPATDYAPSAAAAGDMSMGQGRWRRHEGHESRTERQRQGAYHHRDRHDDQDHHDEHDGHDDQDHHHEHDGHDDHDGGWEGADHGSGHDHK